MNYQNTFVFGSLVFIYFNPFLFLGHFSEAFYLFNFSQSIVAYYLGHEYIPEKEESSFLDQKCANSSILGITSLGLNHGIHPHEHGFVS